MPEIRRGLLSGQRLSWVLAVVFLAHALTYLYFFVDDEAIPYVYARNLVSGRGLVYNPADGPVEGYSDFLWVIVGTILHGVARLLQLPPLSVFAAGTLISLACGVATVLVGGLFLIRLEVRSAWSRAAALVPLALAGPLAVWSCSSLEAVPVALTVALLCYALAGDAPSPRLATATAIVLVLMRIDGWIWVGGICASWIAFGSPAERRAAWRHALLPGAAATVGMAAFRLVYFRDWLPMPVYAKVLFKLHSNGQLVERYPDTSYLAGYLRVAPWPFLALLGAAALPALRRREGRALLAAVVLLMAYVNFVGDWMFGFRFLTPLLVPAFVIVALGVERIRTRAPILAAAIVVALVTGATLSARRFEANYENQPLEIRRENFWKVRSFEPRRFFRPYYDLITALRPLAPPGTPIAYNQAGLIPYVLDLPNIDDLGICSRFYAELPATDVAYTEVGRYEPLTDRPVISARRAYLLKSSPRFIIGRTDLLRRANADRIPPSLFGGYYRLRAVTDDRENAIYERTPRPAARYQVDPTLFTENLAHVSRLRDVAVNGNPIARTAFLPELPFLREAHGTVIAADRYTLDVRFSAADVPVREIYIDTIHLSRAATLRLSLVSAAGGEVWWRDWALPAGYRRLQEPVEGGAASGFSIAFETAPETRARVILQDVRVMGQSPELAAFVRRELGAGSHR